MIFIVFFAVRHKDGSVRLWLCCCGTAITYIKFIAYIYVHILMSGLLHVYFTDKRNNSVVSFKLALVVYTAEYYDIKESNVRFITRLIDRPILLSHTLVVEGSAVGSISCDSMQLCEYLKHVYVTHHFLSGVR